MVFWVLGAEGLKDSTKGICRTCWTKLESCVEGGKKEVGSKKGDIEKRIVLLGFRRVTSISLLKSRIVQEDTFDGSS